MSPTIVGTHCFWPVRVSVKATSLKLFIRISSNFVYIDRAAYVVLITRKCLFPQFLLELCPLMTFA